MRYGGNDWSGNSVKKSVPGASKQLDSSRLSKFSAADFVAVIDVNVMV